MLTDRVALITGASRGIGRAIAERFVEEGARVVICGRKQQALDEAAAALGPAVTPIVCHVGRGEQIQSLVDQVMRQFGRIDILVNNAGTNLAQAPCL
ncbi:MAG TPA: SDR family NAD(P)-dependent oxidoreductase, partial [Bryobacteraceae bacterium]|nr:SDR family NAD(P)-dependent oxidoreductase [Bryobacteraceae bacterium]